MSPLARVLERVRASVAAGKRPLVVFDLDDTLFSTHTRHLRIMKEFSEQPGIPAASRERARALSALEPHQVRYSIRDTAGGAPGDDAFLDELERFWAQRFFKNEYLEEDAAVPGAARFVAAVASAGGIVVYLTGRDVSVRRGTLNALKKRGFPLPDDKAVLLVLKPRFELEDLGYKVEALDRLAGLGEIVAAFENEPLYLNAMRERFPGMIAVLLKTRHSDRPAVPHPDVAHAPDFNG